jgi:hypothetical protein
MSFYRGCTGVGVFERARAAKMPNTTPRESKAVRFSGRCHAANKNRRLAASHNGRAERGLFNALIS